MTPPETSRGSYLGGYWFIFSDDGRQIAAWGSTVTGLERVYVDRRRVSERRKRAATTAHDFSVGERRYRVSFEVERPVVRCRLERDGATVQALQIRLLQRRPLPMWLMLVSGLGLVGAAAWAAETFELSYWPLLIAVGAGALAVYGRAYAGAEFVVETCP